MNATALHLTKPTGAHRRLMTGTALCKLGWIAFAISMALPAAHVFGWHYGWECAKIVMMSAWDKIQKGGFGYLETLAFANAGMIATPFVWRFLRRPNRKQRVVQILTLTMALLVSWLPFSSETIELGIGYYLWAASFWLLFAGYCRLSSRKEVRPSLVSAAFSAPCDVVESPETLAARRELESFLQFPFGMDNATETGQCNAILGSSGSVTGDEQKERDAS